MALHADVAAFDVCEVHACYYLTVHDEENAVASQKLWQVRIITGAADDFVHGIADGFEFLQLLNLAHYCGLVHIYAHTAIAHKPHQMQKTYAGRQPHRNSNERDGQEAAGKNPFHY